MKHFYSIILFALLLVIGTSCKDDEREIILFSGEAPIYETGGCDNLVTSVSLYTNRFESSTVGIDGGDGEYTVDNTDQTVATAELVSESNNYRRLKLTRKKLGETFVTVKDGSGKSAMLKVVVSEFKYIWSVAQVGIAIKGTVTAEKKAEIEKAFKDTYPVPVGGRYELFPDSWSNPMEQGRLVIYLNDTAVEPIVGRYQIKPVTIEGKEETGYFFTYNNKEYIYFRSYPMLPMGRSVGPQFMDLAEDVTAICKETVSLPEGVIVYRVQRVNIGR